MDISLRHSTFNEDAYILLSVVVYFRAISLHTTREIFYVLEMLLIRSFVPAFFLVFFRSRYGFPRSLICMLISRVKTHVLFVQVSVHTKSQLTCHCFEKYTHNTCLFSQSSLFNPHDSLFSGRSRRKSGGGLA